MPATQLPQVRKLEISEVKLTQQELLGKDVDLDDFNTQMNAKLAVKLSESIVSAVVSRSIDGSSTLVVGISDPKLKLLTSGRLSAKNLDVKINGLWWRYVRLEKQGRTLNLTFEEREVAVLRSYKAAGLYADRHKHTQAEFILSLLKRVKEFNIPYYIPAIHKHQPIFNDQGIEIFPAGNPQGVTKHSGLKVKRNEANVNQIQVANTIMATGMDPTVIPDSNKHKRKIIITALMVATQESVMGEDRGIGTAHVGVFQQSKESGWPASNNDRKDAIAFFDHAITQDIRFPDVSYGELGELVQRAGLGPQPYEQWRLEGDRWMKAYGVLPSDTKDQIRTANQSNNYESASGGAFFYYVGVPPSRKNLKWKKESYWDAIQRMAEDVNWRAFFISGTFYFMDERDLFTTKPRATWSEDSDGIDEISGDYDTNKIAATLTVTLRMGRYSVPPGCVVMLENMGPWNGRWLVETVERDMFSPHGTVSLKKPEPQLAEKYSDDVTGTDDAFGGHKSTDDPSISAASFPVETGPIMLLAGRMVQYYQQGKYKSYNPQDIVQIRKTAAGQPWKSPCGFGDVHPDVKLFQLMLWLIDTGWKIGTFSLCETHPCRSEHGGISQHSYGKAVDICALAKGDVDFRIIGDNSPITKAWIIEVMIAIRQLGPKQVICNGNTNTDVFDQDIRDEQWQNGAVYTGTLASDHTNHIHVGV